MDTKRCEYTYHDDFKIREIWKASLNNFCMDMQDKLEKNVPLKGEPTKLRLHGCPDSYLLEKLKDHLELGHYEDVANFAFLLRQRHPLNNSNSISPKSQLSKDNLSTCGVDQKQEE